MDAQNIPLSEINRLLYEQYSFYSIDKWLYHPERVNLIIEGKYRDVLPITIQFSPTIKCNYACPRCTYGKSKEVMRSRKGKQIDCIEKEKIGPIFSKIADTGIKGVIFTGGGEPLAYKDTLFAMKSASKLGLDIGLFTNGSLLRKRTIIDLLEITPRFIRISLDAVGEEIHQLLHGYKDEKQYYRRVIENIGFLAEEKSKNNRSTTIGIGVSIEPINVENLIAISKEVIDFAPNGGIDYIVFRPMVNYKYGKNLIPSKQVIEYCKKNIPEYEQYYIDFYLNGKQFPKNVFEKANDIIEKKLRPDLAKAGIDVINIISKMKGITSVEHPFKKCRASPWHVFVDHNGKVYNCVEFALNKNYEIGDLNNQSFSEIWNSKKRIDVLDHIDNYGLKTVCPPICVCYELNCLFEVINNYQTDNSIQRQAINKWIKTESEKRVATPIKGKHQNFI
jgi:radical SAM protein with 4Fe4S-binding SPASM domain